MCTAGEFRKPLTPCQTAPPIACSGVSGQSALRGWRKYPHRKGTAKVVQDHPGAWITRVVHGSRGARSSAGSGGDTRKVGFSEGGG